MLRRRVWLNTPWHNYTDKKKHQLTNSEINQYKLYEEDNVAFNHGDFVNCECVTKPSVPVLNKQPNYMIVYNGATIESRYYVLSYQYMDGEPAENFGTYRATFIRDVVVDFKRSLTQQLCRIRRGSLPTNQFTPILVQPEGINLNKIKVNQMDIKSWDGDAQWLTIFYDQTVQEANRTITFDWSGKIFADYQFSTMKSDYSAQGFNLSESGMSKTAYKRTVRSYDLILKGSNNSKDWIFVKVVSGGNITATAWGGNQASDAAKDACAILANNASFFDKLELDNIFDEEYNYDNTSKILTLVNKYNNQLIQLTDKISRIDISTGEKSYSHSNSSSITARVVQVIREIISRNGGSSIYQTGPYEFVNVEFNLLNWQTLFTEVPTTGKLILPGNFKLDDINLGCITIPFGSNITLKNGSTTYTMDSATVKSIATSGWTNTGSSIKDIQILPYCPMGQLNSEKAGAAASNTIDISSQNEKYKIPMTITASDAAVYYGLVVTQSSLDYRFPLNLTISGNLKIESMSKTYRLMSSNHKSGFDFNLALNNGVQYMSMSYTLKPYDTIFRICPVFNENSLYGGNYKDARGLIWQGGFSLSQITDAWVEYKLQNSTYESVFDREIKSLEISQDVARQQEILAYQTAYKNAQTSIDAAKSKAALAGVMGIGSAIFGAAAGNPMALMGAAGALGSGLNSAIGIGAQQETADRNLAAAKESQRLNDTLRAEAIDYKKDIWYLTNQAIEARPSTIAANTEYSHINNSKAYIEVYDCSEVEKEYLTKYLKYHGMKIDQIGLLKNYLIEDGDYIEATPLFLEGLMPVISNAINAELSAGMYVQEGLFNE